MTSSGPSPQRGEVWIVNFDPTVGSEIQKTRPAVVVSSDAVGRLPVKLVVPLTDWKPHYAGNIWHVRLSPTKATASRRSRPRTRSRCAPSLSGGFASASDDSRPRKWRRSPPPSRQSSNSSDPHGSSATSRRAAASLAAPAGPRNRAKGDAGRAAAGTGGRQPCGGWGSLPLVLAHPDAGAPSFRHIPTHRAPVAVERLVGDDPGRAHTRCPRRPRTALPASAPSRGSSGCSPTVE